MAVLVYLSTKDPEEAKDLVWTLNKAAEAMEAQAVEAPPGS
jgi:hypothetical protein